MSRFFKSLVAVLVVFVAAQSVFAAEKAYSPRFGIGAQTVLPAYGISGMFNATPHIAVQAIACPFGDLKAYVARVVYRFAPGSAIRFFGYGQAGTFSLTTAADNANFWEDATQTENAIGFGGGGGAEYMVSPNMGSSLEIGFNAVRFKDLNDQIPSFNFGAGFHYYL